ncbi:transcriptional regulator [Leclercia sp. LSNIH1]|nr:transcriptional regulator [Leclercia sp. LSNIH1]POV36931.1 transcriptional regulator [Leclercia sp. LSNIH5]POW69128.1 transcriptional regulator [Leclercia sp. LSNIH2]
MSRKKAPNWVLFCGLLQTFISSGIAQPRWLWYLS